MAQQESHDNVVGLMDSHSEALPCSLFISPAANEQPNLSLDDSVRPSKSLIRRRRGSSTMTLSIASPGTTSDSSSSLLLNTVSIEYSNTTTPHQDSNAGFSPIFKTNPSPSLLAPIPSKMPSCFLPPVRSGNNSPFSVSPSPSPTPSTCRTRSNSNSPTLRIESSSSPVVSSVELARRLAIEALLREEDNEDDLGDATTSCAETTNQTPKGYEDLKTPRKSPALLEPLNKSEEVLAAPISSPTRRRTFPAPGLEGGPGTTATSKERTAAEIQALAKMLGYALPSSVAEKGKVTNKTLDSSNPPQQLSPLPKLKPPSGMNKFSKLKMGWETKDSALQSIPEVDDA